MSSPAPEQIVTMEARGWTWDGRRFRATGGKPGSSSGTTALWATVRAHGDEWVAIYGTATHDWSALDVVHTTPEAAADEAEAWLRGVLAGFRFPWLSAAP